MKDKAQKNIKMHSVQFNFIMNAILTVSSFIFPLITFPYISRTLLVDGIGKVNFATSVISYFTMFASLGIPTHKNRTGTYNNKPYHLGNNIRCIFYTAFYS